MKTTTMMNNVKALGFLGAQKEAIRVDYVESLADNTVSVDKMKAVGVVPVNAITDLGSVLAKASYAAEVSKVGATTVSMQVGGTNPRVFFNGNGDFKKDTFKKVFKATGKNEIVGKKYETVFVEGVNKFSQVDFEMGIRYTIFLVNKATIKRYQDELSMMCLDTVKDPSDLEQIVIDLDPIARALQESSIDVTKDKSKDFGIYATDIIGSEVQALNVLIKKGGLLNNLDECIKEPKKTTYEATTNVLIDADSEAVDTNASAAQLAILEGTNVYMNRLLENYGETTNDDYKYAIKVAKNYRSFVWFIRKTTDAMVGRLDEDGRLTKEAVRRVRDAIYAEAQRQKVPKEDVIKCAIAAGYTTFYKNADGDIKATSNINKFRFATIAKIFDDIFVQEYAGKDYLEVAINVDNVFEDVEEGTEVFIKDGFGTIDNKIVLSVLDVDAEGTAVVRDGKLMLQYNALNSVETNYRILMVDNFLERQKGEWVEAKMEGMKSIETQIDRLLNCSCGVRDNLVLAKNPATGKAVRVATLNENFDMPKGGIKVVDVIASPDNNGFKGTSILVIEA